MDHIQNPELVMEISKVFFLMALGFVIAMGIAPIMTHFLYKYRIGKRIREGKPVFEKLHQKKAGTPTMGGIMVWMTVLVVILFFWLVSLFWPDSAVAGLNFLTRSQTLLPLGVLIATALVGMVDDLLNVLGVGARGGGLRIWQRLIVYTGIASFGAWWFFVKLEWDTIHIPGIGSFEIGWWYIPLFILVIVATSFSVNEADGLDGLAGGILATCFGAYAVIAFVQGRIDLAAFCGVIMGALLAFLWFNVYPARFFMGDTGAMALGTTLGVVAMLTNSALVLIIIAFPLVIESGSVLIQVTAKKLFGRKVFRSTPIHHHFEAIGWPETKVTMRFWIIAAVSAGVGLIIGLIGRG